MKGGNARAKKLSATKRKAIMKKAARALKSYRSSSCAGRLPTLLEHRQVARLRLARQRYEPKDHFHVVIVLPKATDPLPPAALD
jgi:hypothetical protein